MRVSVLIPAYHEQATIADVVRQVGDVDIESLGLDKEIIVCDDGSTDQTAREVERVAAADARVRLVRHPHNRGKGAALRSALAQATGEISLVQDADLEYSIDDYRALLQPIVENRADVVYGSRFLQRSWPRGMHPANFLANKILTTTANKLYGHAITDEATAFKVFRTDIMRSLALECDGFEFCPEVTAKLGLSRVRILEVPIRYTARNAASGKKVKWTDGFRAFWTLLRFRINGWRPQP
jgi:dolichol-phosphate mannosyltransferase